MKHQQGVNGMDWKRIITDIINKGYTWQQIADECAMTKGQVYNLASGTKHTCYYETGVRLLDLHKRTRRMRNKARH